MTAAPAAGVGSRGAILIALAGIALLLVATGVAYRTPAAPRDLPAAEFSASRARAAFATLPGADEPHPMGSAANAALRAGLLGRLAALGYAPETQSGFVCNAGGECGMVTNIVARLDGAAGATVEGRRAVLLAAHYDSVPAGPGASDDGAGAAAVLEIARILKLAPPPRPVVLLIDDGEEAGLLGATLFVRDHRWAGEIAAAVNLDNRGTSGPALMFETGTSNAWSVGLYSRAVRRPVTNSLFYLIYKLLPNDTDFTVFKDAGYQGFNFAFIGMVGRYHTPLDNWANADPGSLQDAGEHALASLRGLSGADDVPAPPPGEAVYFDLFGRTLVHWPASASLPAALGALVLLIAECGFALRARLTGVAPVVWGMAAALLGWVLGLAVAVGLQSTLNLLGIVPPGFASAWVAYPLPTTIAYSALAFLPVGAVSVFFARRAGPWGFWFAASLLIAALAVVLAWRAPAACFVFLIPAWAAGLGFLPSLRPGAVRRLEIAALPPVLLLFALLLPLLWFLYTALGTLAWPITTTVLCMAALTLLPLLAAAARRQRQTLTALAALIAIAGALVGLALPGRSLDWPQAIDLEYWQNAADGSSSWLARTAAPLPAALAAAGHFAATAHARFPGSLSRAFYATAPSLALPPPQLDVLDATPSGPATSYRLRLRSPRGAPAASVIFPAALHVDAADLVAGPGHGRLHVRLERMRSGARALRILSLPAEGLEFTVDAAGTPVLQVFDMSYGLPREGAFLQAARPPTAVSFQEGDVTISYRRVTLEPAFHGGRGGGHEAASPAQ